MKDMAVQDQQHGHVQQPQPAGVERAQLIAYARSTHGSSKFIRCIGASSRRVAPRARAPSWDTGGPGVSASLQCWQVLLTAALRR